MTTLCYLHEDHRILHSIGDAIVVQQRADDREAEIWNRDGVHFFGRIASTCTEGEARFALAWYEFGRTAGRQEGRREARAAVAASLRALLNLDSTV